MVGKPILLVDFDGVIHSYESGWKGAAMIPDPPVAGAMDFLRAALEHFHVNIYSSRSKDPGGIAAMLEWFIENGAGDLIEEMYFPQQKPAAFLTIDDRCIQFRGAFPPPEELLKFKPWNKP